LSHHLAHSAFRYGAGPNNVLSGVLEVHAELNAVILEAKA
jgi:hypothetical protein